MIKFLKNILNTGFLCIAGFAFAAEPENILMIEVQGSANGIIEIELLPEFAPSHVERIKILARDGVYNNVSFHRVIEGFMAQTGDVKFGKIEGYKQRYAGQGGSNYPDLEAEFSDVIFEEDVDMGDYYSSVTGGCNVCDIEDLYNLLVELELFNPEHLKEEDNEQD